MKLTRAGFVVAVVGCSSPAAKPKWTPPTGPVQATFVGPPTADPTKLSPAEQQRDQARVALATSVVDAYQNWNGLFSTLVARWSPDGSQIVFGSMRDGLPEVYVADPAKPGSPALALTQGPQRAVTAQFTRDGKALLFMRDTGGDENFAIWRIDRDGKNPVNLTPNDKLHREEPILPSKRPTTMLYSAARVTAPDMFLFQQDVTGGEPKQIYTQPMPGMLLDATSDGARALVAEFHSDADIIVRELDIATGTAHRVFPPEGVTAGLYAAAYAADGKRIFLTTDQESRVALLALDPATGKELARYHDTLTSAQLTMAPSPTGDVIALGVDAGNHGEIRILDAKRLTVVRSVKAPLGDVHLGSFRDDGRAFSILISLPNQPADIFSVETKNGTVSPLRDDPRPGLAALSSLDVSIENVRAFDAQQIPVNVYLPKHAPDQKLPVIVSFHGGPSFSYAVRWSPFTRFLSALGYAVIEPNVRGSTGFGKAWAMADNREKRADWLQDVAAVNKWVKEQRWADPERVVVMGGSYGGYTTLMALTRQPTAWAAGVDLFGPADLKAFLLSTDAMIRSAFVAEFGDVEKDAQLIEEFSPMRDVDRIVKPLFVYAGQNDPRVPRSESDAIVLALRKRKVLVEYMVAPNEGHSVDHRETKIELCTRLARFLEDSLH